MSQKRSVLIAGNWKMNHGFKETENFFRDFKKKSHAILNDDDLHLIQQGQLRVSLIPPYLSLERAQSLKTQLDFSVSIAAQNAHWETHGAFTGEVSGPMLKELGINQVLIGHSERRRYFGESNELVHKRAAGLLKQGFDVILCLGETLAEREAGQTKNILTQQMRESVLNLDLNMNSDDTSVDAAKGAAKLVLAYEPVWAIGTGRNATPDQIEEAHQDIRHLLQDGFGEERANAILVLYGGSVTAENADTILACDSVDGALVGGASLNPEVFLKLVKSGAMAKK